MKKLFEKVSKDGRAAKALIITGVAVTVADLIMTGGSSIALSSVAIALSGYSFHLSGTGRHPFVAEPPRQPK